MVKRYEPEFYFSNPEELSKSLGRRSARSGLISIGTQAIKFINQLITIAILARLLTPRDFGLVAMGLAFVSIFKMFTGQALATGVVQQKRITPQQVSSFFWMSFFFCMLIAFISVGCAPAISWFYKESDIKLIVIALSFQIIIAGFSSTHLALLQRTMQFGLLSATELASGIISKIVAIILALSGAGYWALIMMNVLYDAIRGVLSWFFCSWRPTFSSSIKEGKSLLQFGSIMSAQSILTSISGQLDSMLLGRYCGSKNVGFYTKAYNLVRLPYRMLFWPMENVAISAISRAQSDKKKLVNIFLKLSEYMILIFTPIMLILCICAKDVVIFLLGNQWIPAIPILKWLSCETFLIGLSTPIYCFLVGTGQLKKLFICFSVLNSFVRIIAIIVGISWGPVGVAISLVIGMALFTPFSIWYSLKDSIISIEMFIRSIWKPILSALASVVLFKVIFIKWSMRLNVGLLNLIINAAFILIVYITILMLLPGGYDSFKSAYLYFQEDIFSRLRGGRKNAVEL